MKKLFFSAVALVAFSSVSMANTIEIEVKKGNRILLIGGEPFETPILLWWNFVARTMDDLKEAREQWINHDARFGEIPDYVGARLEAPVLPDQMRASK